MNARDYIMAPTEELRMNNFAYLFVSTSVNMVFFAVAHMLVPDIFKPQVLLFVVGASLLLVWFSIEWLRLELDVRKGRIVFHDDDIEYYGETELERARRIMLSW